MDVRSRGRPGLALLAPLLLVPPAIAQDRGADPLQPAVARLRAWVGSSAEDDEISKSIRAGAAPLLEDAAEALGEGRRALALSRLAAVWADVEAAAWLSSLPDADRSSMQVLEEEWRRAADELTPLRPGAPRPALDHVPAAARAVGEAALSEVGTYYEASREYGAATAPLNGLFYLGSARAHLGFARLVADLPARDAGVAPLDPRSVLPEIAALERELLAAYVPPASIDRHPQFIRISGQLKQAAELDGAGLRHGALLRLLEARLRLSRLLVPERTLDAAATAERARAFEAGLGAQPRDPSLARMFVEIALAAASDPDPAVQGGATAGAVFGDVLPLYATALGPAPPQPPAVPREATLTVVRWPYT